MSVRVTETATVLALGRVDFAALLARQDPSAFRLKRRLAALFTARLRNQLRHLAVSLGGERPARRAEDAARTFADLEDCGPPDSKYVRRMATFHDFDPLALWGFLTSGSYARCPPGRTLLAEGAPSTACYLTINGAVEKVLIRGDRRIRVGLAGPGKAFGYESLIDGQPVPGHRDHAGAGAPARPAARPVRAALQRRGRRLPRLPRRDPAGAGGHVAPDVAPARPPRGERLADAMAAGAAGRPFGSTATA